jgi:hypothetical protein
MRHVWNAEGFVAFHCTVDDIHRVATQQQVDERSAGALPALDFVLAHSVDEIVLLARTELRELAAAVERLTRIVDGGNRTSIKAGIGWANIEDACFEQCFFRRNRELLIDEMGNTCGTRARNERLTQCLDSSASFAWSSLNGTSCAYASRADIIISTPPTVNANTPAAVPFRKSRRSIEFIVSSLIADRSPDRPEPLPANVVPLASSATLAESSIDILLWRIPLNSRVFWMLLPRSANVSAQVQRGRAPPMSTFSFVAMVTTSCPARYAACMGACVRGEEEHAICDILRLPGPAERYPGFGHFVRIDRHVASGR